MNNEGNKQIEGCAISKHLRKLRSKNIFFVERHSAELVLDFFYVIIKPH